MWIVTAVESTVPAIWAQTTRDRTECLDRLSPGSHSDEAWIDVDHISAFDANAVGLAAQRLRQMLRSRKLRDETSSGSLHLYVLLLPKDIAVRKGTARRVFALGPLGRDGSAGPRRLFGRSGSGPERSGEVSLTQRFDVQ